MKKILALFSVLACLLGGLQTASLAQITSKAHCSNECTTCAETCTKTLAYCKGQGGMHTARDHVTVLQDCISTCKQSADFISRGSSLQKQACALCAQACSKCAESCEAMTGDKAMQDCAGECRKCADACKKMVS